MKLQKKKCYGHFKAHTVEVLFAELHAKNTSCMSTQTANLVLICNKRSYNWIAIRYT